MHKFSLNQTKSSDSQKLYIAMQGTQIIQMKLFAATEKTYI